MRKLLLVMFFLQYLIPTNAQSIVVNGTNDPESTYTAEQLLTDVLLDGGLCSSATNFQLKDNPSDQFPSADRSWGFFKRGNSSFPFEQGVILTSGSAKQAEGPDDTVNVSHGGYNWIGDPDAVALVGTNTTNATVFEFDFIPQSNEISFNYIFASEEYPTFACTTYNDTFAFIISGPGITPDPGLSGKNIALLPNGNWVTINTVNDKECGNEDYYVPGRPDNPFTDIQYGGRTIPLTAYSQVIPGETYHIRLLVADAVDTGYDSAVFLEAGSFSLGSVIVDSDGADLGEDVKVCGQDEFTLHVNVTDPSFTIQWYFNGNIIPGATGSTLTVTEAGLYKVVLGSGACTAEDEVNITFGELDTNGTIFSIEMIDYNDDGVEIFNLTTVQPQIVDNPGEMTFVYYTTFEDAENEQNPIANPTAFTAADNTIVYARVTDEGGCSAIVEIVLKVKEDCIYPEAACSDSEGFGLNIPFLGDGEIPTSAPSGPNYSCLYNQPYPRFYYFKIAEPGNLHFFLNQYTQPDQQGTPIDVDFIVWGPFTEVPCAYESLQTVVDCSYSASAFEEVTIPNAEAGEYYVMMITNYAGSYNQFGYVNLIFDENSTGAFDCSIVSGEKTFKECDNDLDGQAEFDLASISAEILEDQTNWTLRFYSTEEDATEDTEDNIIPTAPYTINEADAPVAIYAQVKNQYGLVEKVIKVNLDILEGVTGAHNADIFVCDEGGDGVEEISLWGIEVIENQSSYTIQYYENEQDAIEGNAAFIPNPLSYETGTGIVYVRIENENGCFTIVEIHIEVGGLEVDLGNGFSMCEGSFELIASGDFSNYTNVTFTWARNGVEIEGENEQTLIITQTGTYSVKVTTAEGCEGTDSIVVSPGTPAEIIAINVGSNFVTVDATGGAQPYQYSMTGVVWQNSNQFNYLQPGIHTVYVKTDEGCIVSEEFAIFSIPTMFTPNGDGINDTWNIPGLEIYPGSYVVIYDRDGRLVHQAELTSHVIWDGFFINGQKAPTQDYWYIINVSDGRTFSGHITVKSRGEKN
ncbi:MAG: choice-of-anchor L domain-containing protein [Weeksellaceae bacterium]|nr:choice-of-anchor L domain-containing protein [Weeksellaceae bacterium]